MKKMINTEHIEGRVYEHDLAIKTVQNQESDNFGKEFIAGSLNVATDDAGLNVIAVHFTYVTPTTKAGKKNSTFSALKKIIEEGKAIVTDGDNATKVKIDTALALNDFYGQDDSLISVKKNEGGFVTIVGELSAENERNTFTTDMLITNIVRVDADEEKNITEAYVAVRGAIFNFRNDILPVEFVVKNPEGMKYFENLTLTPSEPIFTKIWGRINSTTQIIEKTEDSAFGEAAVKTFERKTKEWVITGAQPVPYDYGDENCLTAEDIIKATQNREVYLAEVKKKAEEYKASKASNQTSAFAAAPSQPVAAGGFNF